ncbi:hypothetical protein ACFL43_04725 [Thermodesulfobacteriota bacterium]
MKRQKIVVLQTLLSILLAALLGGCNQGVSVTPLLAVVVVGQTKQFSAAVPGADNATIVWSVDEDTPWGSISQSGLYSAPASVPPSPVATIRATVAGDETKTGTAKVTIVDEPTEPTITTSIPRGSAGDSDSDGLSDDDELSKYGSNPLDDDTDGDGYLDGEEVSTYAFDATNNRYRFNPVIADIPQFSIKVASLPSIEALYTVTEESSGATSVSSSHTDSTSVSTTRGGERTNTVEAGISATFGVASKIGFEGGTSFSFSATASFSYGFSESFNWSTTQARENSDTYEKALTNTDTYGTTFTNGTLSVLANIYNEGNIDFTVDNLVISVTEFDSANPDQAKPVTNLIAGTTQDIFPNTTIHNGESIQAQFSADDLSYATTIRLLGNSRNLIFSPSTYQLLDAQGNAISHTMTTVKSKTAKITIDYGYGRTPEQYYVATRLDSNNPGISLAEALGMLDVPYATDPVTWSLVDASGQSRSTTFSGITKVRDVQSRESINNYWALLHTVDDGVQERNYIYSANLQDFDPSGIVLKAGHQLSLIYMQDEDGDLIPVREEVLNNSSDSELDSDVDGISDFNELRAGWYVLGTLVYSSPGMQDTDFDGLKDPEERGFCDALDDGVSREFCYYNNSLEATIADDGLITVPTEEELLAYDIVSTNPRSQDTDGDGILDPIDTAPTQYDQIVALENFEVAEVTAASVVLQWTRPSTILYEYDGAVIIRHPSSEALIINLPANGREYTEGDTLSDAAAGDSTVVCVRSADELGTSFTDDTVSPGATYYYTAQVYKGSGADTLYFPPVSPETPVTTGMAVSDLAALASYSSGDHTVSLSWTNPQADTFAGVLILRSAASLGSDFTIPKSPSFYKNTSTSGDLVINNAATVIYVGSGTSADDVDLDYSSVYYYSAFAYTDETDAASYSTPVEEQAATYTRLKMSFTDIQTDIGDGAGGKCELYWKFTWSEDADDQSGVFSRITCANKQTFSERMDQKQSLDTSDEDFYNDGIYVDTVADPSLTLTFYIRENDGGCDTVTDIKGEDGSGDDESYGKKSGGSVSYKTITHQLSDIDGSKQSTTATEIEHPDKTGDDSIELYYTIEVMTPGVSL